MRLNEMPNEILLIIFQQMSIKEKVSVERVCRRWQSLIGHLFLALNSLRINNGWALSHYRGCLDARHNVPVGNLFYVINETGHYWRFVSQLDYFQIWPVVSRCPNIRSLHLENCRIECATFLWLVDCFPALECLSLVEVTGFFPEHWLIIAHRLANKLKHFAVSDCQNIYSESLLSIIPSLEELNLIHFSTPLSVLINSFGDKMRKLTFKCCTDLTAQTVTLMANSPVAKQLTHLTVDDPWLSDEDDILKLICRNLSNLKLLSIGFGAQSSLFTPVLNLKSLTHLELSASLERWQQVLAQPIGSMPKIESLLVSAYFAPKHFAGIEKVFPRCRKLRLYYYCECNADPNKSDLFAVYCDNCQHCQAECKWLVRNMTLLVRLNLNGILFQKNLMQISA